MGGAIAPTVYPYGPEWSGKTCTYSPSYNTPHSGGSCPPPMYTGTLRRSTDFPVQPEPLPKVRAVPVDAVPRRMHGHGHGCCMAGWSLECSACQRGLACASNTDWFCHASCPVQDPFGTRMQITFELRKHSQRNVNSENRVTIHVGNHQALGQIIDAAMYKAFATGALTGRSHRIISVCGPSGKLLKIGSG